jgi:hypothetical protein
LFNFLKFYLILFLLNPQFPNVVSLVSPPTPTPYSFSFNPCVDYCLIETGFGGIEQKQNWSSVEIGCLKEEGLNGYESNGVR